MTDDELRRLLDPWDPAYPHLGPRYRRQERDNGDDLHDRRQADRDERFYEERERNAEDV